MNFLRVVRDLVYPRRCPWCNAVVGFSRIPCACGEDRKHLKLPTEKLKPSAELAGGWVLAAAYACYEYESPVRDAVLRMKFEGEADLAGLFAEDMADVFAKVNLADAVDVMVAVPVSNETMKTRGYNQSGLMAAELSKKVAAPYVPDALKKVRETEAQRMLSREERLTNVIGAYAAAGPEIIGKRVLLVDDIKTTGSTLNECAKTLLAAGARECLALTVAAVL